MFAIIVLLPSFA